MGSRGSGMGRGRVPGEGVGGIDAVTSGVALSRQQPGSSENGRARSSWHTSRGGGKGGSRAPGPTRRNSSFFNLINVISNGIDLIQIKDGIPEI
jgi:hypothetical protein